MPETLTADEIREFRDMRAAWPQVQAALKMGTSLTSSYDGHMHREMVIQEHGSGTPVHTAKQRTLYWADTAKKLFMNNDGATSWTEVGGGGVSGTHTMLTGTSGTHTDTDSAVVLIRGDMFVVSSNGLWDRLRFDISGHGTDAILGTINSSDPAWVNFTDKAIAAVPFQNYIPFGAVEGGQSTTPQ